MKYFLIILMNIGIIVNCTKGMEPISTLTHIEEKQFTQENIQRLFLKPYIDAFNDKFATSHNFSNINEAIKEQNDGFEAYEKSFYQHLQWLKEISLQYYFPKSLYEAIQTAINQITDMDLKSLKQILDIRPLIEPPKDERFFFTEGIYDINFLMYYFSIMDTNILLQDKEILSQLDYTKENQEEIIIGLNKLLKKITANSHILQCLNNIENFTEDLAKNEKIKKKIRIKTIIFRLILLKFIELDNQILSIHQFKSFLEDTSHKEGQLIPYQSSSDYILYNKFWKFHLSFKIIFLKSQGINPNSFNKITRLNALFNMLYIKKMNSIIELGLKNDESEIGKLIKLMIKLSSLRLLKTTKLPKEIMINIVYPFLFKEYNMIKEKFLNHPLWSPMVKFLMDDK